MSAPFNAAPGYVEVPALRPAPPRSSLLTAAEVITDSTVRWEGGYVTVPPMNSYFGTYVLSVCGDYTNLASPRNSDCEPILTDPFVIYSSEATSSFNRQKKDLYQSTLDNLLAIEPYYVESEFLFNSLGSNSPYLFNPANNFMPATTSSAGPFSVADGIGFMDFGIQNTVIEAMRPMIIVSRRMMAHLTKNLVVRREGNLWLSPSDHVVVPVAAFNGLGPNGQAPTLTTEYIYAVTGVQIRRSEIVVIPERVDPTDGNPFGYPASAVDRSNNNIAVTTQRLYGIAFASMTDPNHYSGYGVLYAPIDLSL